MVTNGQAPPEALVAKLLDVVGSKHAEEIMTAGEQLIERGRQEGMKQTLLAVLRARFGALPDVVMAAVRAADSAQLDSLTQRVAIATTLDEILAG